MSTHMSIHMSIHRSIHMSMHMSIHMSVHMTTHMCIHMPTNVSSRVYPLVFSHTHAHVSTYASAHVHTHARTYVQTPSVHVPIAAMTDDPCHRSARCVRALTPRSCETAVTDEPAVMCARPLPCRPTMPSRTPGPATEQAVPTAAPLMRSGDDRWMVMMPPSLLLSIWSILTAFMWVCRHISWC